MSGRICDKCGSLMELAEYRENTDMVSSSEKQEEGAKYFYGHINVYESIWVCICGNKKRVSHLEEDESIGLKRKTAEGANE